MSHQQGDSHFHMPSGVTFNEDKAANLNKSGSLAQVIKYIAFSIHD